jgi:hypothetical protein
MTRPRDIADSINRINSSAADATAVTIDSSEQVGIGTATPNSYYSKELVVAHGTEGGITLVGAAGTATGYLMFADGTTGNEAYRGYVGYSHSTPDVMVFGTSGAERMRILSGGGITFNGDTATANALDDYEEGTWTPTITASGTNPTASYSAQNGRYTKVGNMVTIFCMIGLSAYSGGSGVALVSGLPFTIGNDNANNGNVYCLVDDLSFDRRTVSMQSIINSTTMNIIENGGTTATHAGLAVSDLTASSIVRFQYSYVI